MLYEQSKYMGRVMLRCVDEAARWHRIVSLQAVSEHSALTAHEWHRRAR